MCGAAYPGGPVMCDYPRAATHFESPAGPIARVSASYAYTSTTLLFGGDKRADMTRHAVFGATELPLSPRVSFQIGAGGIAGGELVHGTKRDAIGPGFSGFVGLAGRIYDGKGALPFVQLTGAISGTHMLTRTERAETPRWTAFDLRIGLVAGKTIADVFTPYATARVFGGPAYWTFDGEKVTGTDLHKYQLGGGLSLALFSRRLDVFAEGVPLGERGVAAGLGTTFF